MFCNAKPARANIERLRAEVEPQRHGRFSIDDRW
jgi:hypothetical protein